MAVSVCSLCHDAGATQEVRIYGLGGTRKLHAKCLDALEGLGLPMQRVEPPPPRNEDGPRNGTREPGRPPVG